MKSIRVIPGRIKRESIMRGLKLVDAIFDKQRALRYFFKKNGYHRNDYSFEKDQIAFIHLPKTGGTTFSKLLAHDTQDRFVDVRVHRPISRFCPPQTHKYVTILRDPVNQVWSYYQMLLGLPKDWPYRKYANQGIEHLIQNCFEIRNLTCRYMVGEVFNEPTKETFEKAKINLRLFYKVLDFEKLAEEVPAFLEAHSIPFEKMLHERKAEYNPPNNSDVETIKKYNEWDIKLFDFWQRELKDKS